MPCRLRPPPPLYRSIHIVIPQLIDHADYFNENESHQVKCLSYEQVTKIYLQIPFFSGSEQSVVCESHMCSGKDFNETDVGLQHITDSKLLESKHRSTQDGDETDPIVLSAYRILTKDIHKTIVDNQEMLISCLSTTPDRIAASLHANQVITVDDYRRVTSTEALKEKANILVSVVLKEIKIAPEKLQTFFSEAEQLLPSKAMEILQSRYCDLLYNQYKDYLKFLYASLHPFANQWLSVRASTFFRPAMIKIQKGEIVNGTREVNSIRIENIFKESKGRRKVILLEGAAGCGKSTISEYICQQWEEDKLFQQFELVILVRMQDQSIRNAKDLADLLPCPDTATARHIASRMIARNCQGVLFILDEWSELPQTIFHMLVKSELPQSSRLCQSAVIVTSRPTLSGRLHPSLRVEIMGFTPETVEQFFKQCLDSNIIAVKTLMQMIEGNPELVRSWYLPLDALIFVYLFKCNSYCNNALSTNLYAIYSSLVVICVKNHLTECTQLEDVSIESIDQLLRYAKEPFKFLCQLAFRGIMENKIVFTSLPSGADTLSLLQDMESFTGHERTLSYKFIHLHIQELMAAWYIVLNFLPNEQVSKFNELINKPRFSMVLKFYAAITTLKTSGISNIVKKSSITALS